MKGIYLNDIPMDLFLKYFSQSDLKDSKLTPVMENYRSKLDTYQIVKGGVTYLYRTSATVNFADNNNAIDVITKDINYSFIDLFPSPSFLLSGTYIIDRLSTDNNEYDIYSNPIVKYIYPYRYYFENVDSVFNYFIEVQDSDDEVINLETSTLPLSNLKLVDARRNVAIVSNVTVSKENGFYTIRDGLTLLGKLYLNDTFKVNTKDAFGNYLYLDQFQNQTTLAYQYSNFIRHNNMLRVGFNGLIDHSELLFLNFNPSCVGIVDEGRRSKLKFYEPFTKNKQYKIVSEEQSIFTLDTVDSVLWDELDLVDNKTKVDTENLKFSKEILDISTLPTFKGSLSVLKENTITFRPIANYSNTGLNVGDVIIAENYKEKSLLRGKYYDIIQDVNGPYIKYAGNDTRIIVEKSFYFAVIQLQKDAEGYFINIEKNNKLEVVRAIKIGTTNFSYFINIDADKYIVNKSVTSFGFIKIPVKIVPNEREENKYIGTIESINNGSVTLAKYNPTISPISISEVFNLDGFTELDQFNYRKINYVRDIIDRSRVIEVTETISKVPFTYNYDYTEFLDHEHSITTGTGKFETIRTGKKVVRANEITRPITLEKFRNNLATFDHLITDGFLSKRGQYVDDDVILNMEKSVFSQMITEFLNKDYSNFFVTSNLSYSNEGTFKMRAFANGLLNILSSDKTNYPLNLKRQRILDYSDINLKVITNNQTDQRNKEYIIGRDYDKNLGLRYALANVKSINTFEKLSDYKNFATDNEREDYLKKEYIRQVSYLDRDSSLLINNDIFLFDKKPRRNLLFKIDFKDNLAELISGYFAEFNQTVPLNKYKEDYRINYKKKFDSLTLSVSPLVSEGISEKAVYSGLYTDVDVNNYEKELIETIFNSEENWEVI